LCGICLQVQEIFYINKYKCVQKGYNIRSGGNNKKLAEETKKIMSESTKGVKNPMYGKTHTDEVKKRISELTKGVKNPMYGKTHTDEVKKRISESKKGCKQSDEMKNKISKPVLQLDKNSQFIKEWCSIIDAEKDLGIYHITTCCKGTQKTAGGYIWKYA